MKVGTLSSWLEFVSWEAPGLKLGRVVRTTVARVAVESTGGKWSVNDLEGAERRNKNPQAYLISDSAYLIADVIERCGNHGISLSPDASRGRWLAKIPFGLGRKPTHGCPN